MVSGGAGRARGCYDSGVTERPARALLTAILVASTTAFACSSRDARDVAEVPDPTTPTEVEPVDATPSRPPETQTRPAETGHAPAPDAGTPSSCTNAPAGSACGVSPQCGCAADATCDVVDSAGSTACVTAGRFSRGAPCTSTVGCAQGLTCVFGTCHAFCAEPGKACASPGTGACVQVNGTGGQAIPGFAVCRTACDLRDPSSCTGTNAAGTGVCMTDDEGGTDCYVGGTKKLNETCAVAEDCGPALVCVAGSGNTGQCKRWCRVGTTDCGTGVTCRSFAPKVTVSGVEYGVCP